MTEKIKFKNLEKTINECFHKKYKIDYNNYIIENIIFNEKSHLVSIFKDNLITNDDYEFFKEFYPIKDSIKRLIKYIEYYQKYNYLFPNYSALPESEYLFRNINRKQRIIDEQQNNKKKQIINNIINIYKHNKINKIKLNENENEKIINDYYSNQKFIRNGSPYLNDDEKRKIEEIKNKSKFLNNKGFFTSVGKYSMPIKYISNYVQLSPSENPSIHQFRTIDKLKWITKKGFIKC
jgi:hypothetical protein